MSNRTPVPETKDVLFITYEGVQSLDLLGPWEIFAAANFAPTSQGLPPIYRLHILSIGGPQVTTSSGFPLGPFNTQGPLPDVVDTLIVPGGTGQWALTKSRDAMAEVYRLSSGARRICSVCTGAFILASAGLLEGRRVTTHWAYCGALSKAYPSLQVEADPIHTKDGPFYTSAGVTAGMDLALALVEEDLGPKVSLEIARWFVLFLKRPGGQSQFSAHLQTQMAESPPLQALQLWIQGNLGEDLTVPNLAKRAGMSQRNFARRFRQEVGSPPGRYVEALRLEAARERLIQGTGNIDEIAQICGFSNAEVMRRAFVRRVGVPPSLYRRRFATPSQFNPTLGVPHGS